MNIEEIFSLAVKRNASDVHLVVGLPPILRVDGLLQKIEGFPLVLQKDLQGFLEKSLNEIQKKNFLENKELDLSFVIPQENTRLRVNIFWEKNNLALAARIIWPHIPTMEEIDMPPVAYELCKLSHGLIIVTGPAGCGKSTTLAAMVEHINNNRNCHIVTLEDPIEFVFSSKKSIVAQRELGQDMISFEQALKHVVRQDPNVIMVGEMRDLETISLAVTLAETGHLIFATLHTPSASQTVSRIIDVFPSNQQSQIRLQLSLALKAILCQRLIPRMGGGRVATREVLINNTAISNLIRENQVQQILSAIQTGSRYGMFTTSQDLKRLAKQGAISEESVINGLV
ncbi:type IV pili twitching motility protein PilT [bacterium (Candidatus Moisslbacteria) CG02_land_8_20_14_3_00_36_53]|nr:PilT/PilU family type 4a pilus ATPase [Candidatus Kuenenbacteria bacterium]OIP76291.1 MAG: hypothetical protein AUK09_02385 [Parcubacteria group bacterium CG2_30_36_38]PIV46214.1 MAG: type IV pili twitching motility protein PilT [bacterium (Candidatus Moisslbacteria) CG02_land_8_20_14_3_00_36_53]PIZ90178.1 MAG: type IV pili twitching motility protein PilT [bacterium (Candidatus Moisslbacteria) CG_4_10_14_0_2_um_filter_36_61]PJC00763.1 MAG: type IV pili twitching motility protein PilT [bacter